MTCIVCKQKADILGSHSGDEATMSNPDFSTQYDQTLMAIENLVEVAIEESDIDLDYETVNDILTLTCFDGSSIIITRQSATSQLWLAAKSGGFHFDYIDGQWRCDSDQESLGSKMTAICQSQGGVSLKFKEAGIL